MRGVPNVDLATAPTVESLLAEVHELTKALTGLTCGGSEFFVRRGDRYVADIAACVAYVRRCKEDAHARTIRLIGERQALHGALEMVAKISDHAFQDPKLRADGARALKRIADIAEEAIGPAARTVGGSASPQTSSQANGRNTP